MPGGVAVPDYTFPGVFVFSLLSGRVYSKVDSFQIMFHCSQRRAAEAGASIRRGVEGLILGGLHYQLGDRVCTLAIDVLKKH